MTKVLLIGCGRVGKRHAKILSDYEIEDATLAGVVDIDPERASLFGHTYNVPNFGVNVCYNEIEYVIEIVKPDLITIATPSGMHYEHIENLARFNIPLLVEKPLALTLQDVDKICKLNVPICEVKQNRYNVAIHHLKKAMLLDRLGKPRMANVRVFWSRDAEYYQDWHGQWSMAGGVLANQAIHHIDLLYWLLGDVKRVSAVATYDDYTEVEAGLVATLEFENGCIGTIEVTTLTRPNDLEGSLTILGEKGTVKIGGFAVNKIDTWQFNKMNATDKRIRQQWENPPNVYGFGHIELYKDIVHRMKNNKPMPITLEQSRKVLDIIHAIYESERQKKPVFVGSMYLRSRLGKNE